MHNAAGPWELPEEWSGLPVRLIELALAHHTGLSLIQRVRPGESVTQDVRDDRVRLYVTESGTLLLVHAFRIG